MQYLCGVFVYFNSQAICLKDIKKDIILLPQIRSKNLQILFHQSLASAAIIFATCVLVHFSLS